MPVVNVTLRWRSVPKTTAPPSATNARRGILRDAEVGIVISPSRHDTGFNPRRHVATVENLAGIC